MNVELCILPTLFGGEPKLIIPILVFTYVTTLFFRAERRNQVFKLIVRGK